METGLLLKKKKKMRFKIVIGSFRHFAGTNNFPFFDRKIVYNYIYWKEKSRD